ncbi:MAG: SpoIIE family protein phosphatase [Bacteroidales bacterium]|nr:SpoIIE family protein phosphatase [Bacteroidales bacterium]
MKTLFTKRPKTFASKLSFMLITGTLAVIFLVFGLSSLITRKGLINELIASNTARISIFSNRLEKDLKVVEYSVKNRTSSFREHIDDKDACKAIMKEIAEECNVRESFYALKPEVKGKLMVDALKDENGRIRITERPDNYKYQYHHYYLIPERLRRDYWTPPYFTTIAAQRAITYSHPVLDNEGNLLAVMGADILLESLTDSLDAIVANHAPIEGSYLIILSEDGVYISHPDREKIANETYITDARENDSPELESLVEMMREGNSGSETISLYGRKNLVTYTKLDGVGWGILLATPFDALFKRLSKTLILSLICLLLCLIVAGLLISRITWKMSRPIVRYSDASMKIASGDLDTPVDKVSTGDELQTLGESLENMRFSLKEYLHEMMESAAKRESMEKELSIAHDIQKSMLPSGECAVISSNDIEISGFQEPAKEVGGDLYQYMMKDGCLFFIIGDVSGKGVPASLVMAQTVCLFKAQKSEATPLEIVNQINNQLAEGNTQNMFVTLIVGKMELGSGKLSFCNAGHDPMMLMRNGGVESVEMAHNLPAGLFENFGYKMDELQLQRGDRLVLYTDGIAEAENPFKEFYTLARLEGRLLRCSTTVPAELIDEVIEDVRGFADGAPQSDDITMMCLYYKQ